MKKKLQYLASYLYPVLLQKTLSEYSNEVEVYLDRGEYMLCSPQAMYSYGTQYAPFKKAFELLHIEGHLHTIKDFLLLGGGFCSAVVQLQKKYQLDTKNIVIEKDLVVAQLATNYILPTIASTTIIHGDALEYIHTAHAQFDLLGVDIFIDMHMPKALSNELFIKQCKALLSAYGIIIINTHFAEAAQAKAFDRIFNSVFAKSKVIKHQKNIVYIGYMD